jgi:hypothetical protein
VVELSGQQDPSYPGVKPNTQASTPIPARAQVDQTYQQPVPIPKPGTGTPVHPSPQSNSQRLYRVEYIGKEQPKGIFIILILGLGFSFFLIVDGIVGIINSSHFNYISSGDIILIISGIICFMAFQSLYLMKKIGFIMVFIIGIISIISSLPSLNTYNFLGTAAWIVIISYLLFYHKLFFDQSGLTQSKPIPSHCPLCGKANKNNLEYCYYCGELF